MPRVTVVGAGRTGRGMLGEMFYSEGGYELVFADCDHELVRALADQGSYTMEQVNLTTGESRLTRVEGFEAVDTVVERGRYIDALATSDYVAISVFPSSFEAVADDLADMVAERVLTGRRSRCVVLLGSNHPRMRTYFTRALRSRLGDGEIEHFETWVSLAATKANRKVISDEGSGSPLALKGDDKPKLLVDDVFHGGLEMAVPSFFQPVDDVEICMIEKLWGENLMHCTLGFMGAVAGLKTVNEAASDPYVSGCARLAWEEGRKGLALGYGVTPPSAEVASEMIGKFSSPFLTDSISRVVRQPMRKLGKNERFVGPALLCVNNGIVPVAIARAAAYGFLCGADYDQQFATIGEMRAREGLEGTIRSVCGLCDEDPGEHLLVSLISGEVRELELRFCRMGESLRMEAGHPVPR